MTPSSASESFLARCCGTGVLLVLADDPDVTVRDEKDLLVAVLAPPPPVLAGLTVQVESLSSREAQSSRSVRNEVVLGHGVLDWLKVLLLLLCGEPLVKVSVHWTVNWEIEYFWTMNDEVHDEIVDEVCVLDEVFITRDGTKCWTKTYGQVEGIHLGLIAVPGEIVEEGEEVPGDHQAGLAPLLQHLPHHHHELRGLLNTVFIPGGNPVVSCDIHQLVEVSLAEERLL